VLAVVYLIFNEGYGGRGDLSAEAIWLGRALVELMPDEPRPRLLAMMLLHDSRRDARFRDGDLVLLADQDRSLWDAEQIARPGGARPALASRARALRRAGGDRALHTRTRMTGVRSPRSTASSPGSPVSGRRAEPRRRVAEVEGPRPVCESSISSPSMTIATCTRRGRVLDPPRSDRRGARIAYRRALELAQDDAERRLFARRLAGLDRASSTDQ
jgi:RNA polymerase sigma-70 factor (ECF subfamily)